MRSDMRFKIDVHVVDASKIGEGLSPEADPKFVAAQRDETAAVDAVNTVKQRVDQAERLVARLAAAVPYGRATSAELAAALRDRELAVLLEPGYARRAADAKVATQAAAQVARQAVVAAAGRRRDELEAAAAQVRPLLEALAAAEAALDEALFKLGPPRQCVAPVTWPMSVDDTAALRNAYQALETTRVAARAEAPQA